MYISMQQRPCLFTLTGGVTMGDNRQIEFKYVFSEDYNPIYCNGAYGGVATQGEIIVNFYLERMPLPKSLTHEINPDGSLSGVVETDPSDLGSKVIRYVNSGIILNEASAKSIYEWLGRQICELESRKSAKCPLEDAIGEQNE